MNFIGIDYSITSPAMVVLNEDKPKAFVFHKKELFVSLDFLDIFIFPYPKWNTPQERYHNLAKTLVDNIPDNTVACIENYAYSKGRAGMVFNIAEATQTFKSYCYRDLNIELDVIPPSAVKKYATDNGRAKKEEMAEAFKEETGCNLHETLNCKIDSISCDVIDAWYIAKYCKEKYGEV